MTNPAVIIEAVAAKCIAAGYFKIDKIGIFLAGTEATATPMTPPHKYAKYKEFRDSI